MFRTIDDRLLDTVFQRIVNLLARRNIAVPSAAPFNIAAFFFSGSVVLLVFSCAANFVEGTLGQWWPMAVVPMLGAIALRAGMVEQRRQIAALVSDNPLRWTMLHSRIYTLLMLLLMVATLLLQGVHAATPLLFVLAIYDYWMGLNFMACRLPPSTQNPPSPPSPPSPPGGSRMAP